MSDNEQKDGSRVVKLKKGGNGKRILYAVLLVLMAVIGVAAFVFADRVKPGTLSRPVTYFGVSTDEAGQTGEMSFAPHSKNSFGDLGGGFVLASVGGVEVYDVGGKQIYSESLIMANPVVKTGDGTGIAYDLGGSTLLAFDKAGKIALLTLENTIVDASINSTGWVALTTEESGYKSLVTVYSPEMVEKYRFYSASRFITVAAVSPDGHSVTAAAMGQEGTRFVTELLTYRLDSETLYNSDVIYDRLALDLKYVSNTNMCVVCESQLLYIDEDGTRTEYDFTDRYLKDFDISDDGYAVLVLNKYKAGNRCSIVSVSLDGTVLGSIDCNEEQLSVSAAGKYVAILTAEQLNIYDMAMKPQLTRSDLIGVKRAIMRSDGTVQLIFSDRASAYIPS